MDPVPAGPALICHPNGALELNLRSNEAYEALA